MNAKRRAPDNAERQRVLAAIEAAGGRRDLARKCGVHVTTVAWWLYSERIPERHLAIISDVTGISQRDLRPDLYEK